MWDLFQEFYNKQALQYHLMTHSGETPYECHICDIGFVTNSHLLIVIQK